MEVMATMIIAMKMDMASTRGAAIVGRMCRPKLGSALDYYAVIGKREVSHSYAFYGKDRYHPPKSMFRLFLRITWKMGIERVMIMR